MSMDHVDRAEVRARLRAWLAAGPYRKAEHGVTLSGLDQVYLTERGLDLSRGHGPTYEEALSVALARLPTHTYKSTDRP